MNSFIIRPTAYTDHLTPPAVRELAEDRSRGVIQRGDQMRDRHVVGAPISSDAAGAADCLAVDRDHPPPADDRGPGPHERPDQPVQQGRVQPGQQPAEGGLLRRARADQAEPGQVFATEFAGPLRDRRERAGTGQHRTQRDRHDTGQPMPDTPAMTRIRHLREHFHQAGELDLPRGRRGLRGHG